MVPEHTMWWPMGGMWIFPVIFLVLIVCVAFMVFGRGGCCRHRGGSGRKHSGTEGDDGAIEILNKRYAKGEITKHELEHMKKDILG